LNKSKKLSFFVSKILFVELGVLFISVGLVVLFNNPTNDLMANFISSIFFILGAYSFYPCFIKDERKVINWAENTGNHELMFIFIAIAYGIASLLKGRK
jgi:predicted membrane channel-forming protein YqfA (hemolysin III family)